MHTKNLAAYLCTLALTAVVGGAGCSTDGQAADDDRPEAVTQAPGVVTPRDAAKTHNTSTTSPSCISP
ncbi:MAG: hypothetical protein AAFX99_12690 [Myxococcota bacterium]